MGVNSDCFDDFNDYFRSFSEVLKVDDPLPVGTPRYKITEDELDAQVIHIVYQYLNLIKRKCPPYIFSYAANQVLEAVKLSTQNLHCEAFNDSDNKKEIAQLPHYMPVSHFAIKNSRKKMEDRNIILSDLNTLYGLEMGWPHAFFGVFDGHAGVDAATFCAALLHHFIIQHPLYEISPAKAVEDAFYEIDSVFTRKAEKEKLKGGTTAVVALVREKRLVVAWLGDSQALLVKKRSALQIVKPHTAENEDERKRIEDDGGCVIQVQGAWRVLGQLTVSRAIGDVDYKPFVSSVCDIKSLDIEGDEDFLVLACDGLWDVLKSEDVVAIVFAYLMNNNGDTDGVGRCLVEAARESGSQDNITAVVVFLRPVATLMEEEARRIEMGEVPQMSLSAAMYKDTPPSTINAIFQTQFDESAPAIYNPFSPESVPSYGNEEFLRKDAMDAQAGLSPTEQEVCDALAEVDSLPEDEHELTEEADDEEWSYFKTEPQLISGIDDLLPTSNDMSVEVDKQLNKSPLYLTDHIVPSLAGNCSAAINIPSSEMECKVSPYDESPKAPSSPRSVEGFVTSIELNTGENFGTDNVGSGMFSNGIEQSSGHFSVYVSSSPEPASLDTVVQVTSNNSSETEPLINITTDVNVDVNDKEVTVEITHAQSTVEVMEEPCALTSEVDYKESSDLSKNITAPVAPDRGILDKQVVSENVERSLDKNNLPEVDLEQPLVTSVDVQEDAVLDEVCDLEHSVKVEDMFATHNEGIEDSAIACKDEFFIDKWPTYNKNEIYLADAILYKKLSEETDHSQFSEEIVHTFAPIDIMTQSFYSEEPLKSESPLNEVVFDPSSEKNTLDYSKMTYECNIVIPPAVENIEDSFTESLVSSIVEESLVSTPFDENLVSIPVDKNLASTPVDESLVSTPVDENLVSTPVDENLVSTPVDENLVSTPVDENLVSTPVEENILTTPVDENILSTPVDENILSTPVDENLLSTPVDENLLSTPVDENLLSTPVDENLHSTPVDENLHSTPVDENLHSTPVDENLLSTPVDENLLSTPVDENLLSTPGDENLAAPGDEDLVSSPLEENLVSLTRNIVKVSCVPCDDFISKEDLKPYAEESASSALPVKLPEVEIEKIEPVPDETKLLAKVNLVGMTKTTISKGSKSSSNAVPGVKDKKPLKSSKTLSTKPATKSMSRTSAPKTAAGKPASAPSSTSMTSKRTVDKAATKSATFKPSAPQRLATVTKTMTKKPAEVFKPLSKLATCKPESKPTKFPEPSKCPATTTVKKTLVSTKPSTASRSVLKPTSVLKPRTSVATKPATPSVSGSEAKTAPATNAKTSRVASKTVKMNGSVSNPKATPRLPNVKVQSVRPTVGAQKEIGKASPSTEKRGTVTLKKSDVGSVPVHKASKSPKAAVGSRNTALKQTDTSDAVVNGEH